MKKQKTLQYGGTLAAGNTVRLHSKSGTASKSSGFGGSCSELDAESVFRFFRSAWAVSQRLSRFLLFHLYSLYCLSCFLQSEKNKRLRDEFQSDGSS
ncbi:hypothetical protein X546_12375 [Brevibacillus borstelensis cifa_chp40]|nr:hypothetical protein X546_12375 [Brevibacillus borstelensis cifa_chp40]